MNTVWLPQVNLEGVPLWLAMLPEITLLVFAVAVVLLDLATERKGALTTVSLIGIILAAFFSIALTPLAQSFFHGMLAVDGFAIFFKVLFLGVAFLIILASADYVKKFARFQGEYYALILLATLGMMLMAATADLIAIYVSLEMAGISLYVLAGFLKDKKSTEASLKYLLLGAITSAVLLYGMALIFGTTGRTQLGEIAGAIQTTSVNTNPALVMGIVLLVAGFGFKIAAIPFQMWVPDVYEGAPTTITAYLSVAGKAAGFAVIIRVFSAFQTLDGHSIAGWNMIFAALAVAGMFIGNIAAIPQTNIKRMLAYSSIAQAGYLMVGLAALGFAMPSNLFGESGVLFFLVSYAFTNLGAFIAIIAISGRIESDQISDYAGMGKRAPLLSLALTLCLISLIGIPPAAGFIAKFYLFRTAVENNLLWLVIIAVINSVISAYYYLRVVKVMWLDPPASEGKIPSSPLPRLALAICCAGVLLLGIIPGLAMKLAELAGRIVL